MPAWIRPPKFHVVTGLLVVISFLAIGIKLSSPLLPERQPNRLSIEYSAFLRASDRQKINWYPFSPEPFAIAKRKNMMILLNVGTVASTPAMLMKSRVFEDAEVIRIVNDHYISIQVDLNEMPGIAYALNINTNMLFRTEGSMVILLTSEGEIFDETPYRPTESVGQRQGMLDYLRDNARKWIHQRNEVLQKAELIKQQRETVNLALTKPGEVNLFLANALAMEIVRNSDMQVGALKEVPSVICEQIPGLLFAINEPSTKQLAFYWLLRLRESSSYDQCNGGFFVFSALPNWASPRYGKHTGQSMLMAGLYAYAGREFNAPLFHQTAKHTAQWAIQEMLDNNTNLFFTGMASDQAHTGASPFYEWSRGEIPNSALNIFDIHNTGRSTGGLILKRENNDILAVSERRVSAIQNALKSIQPKDESLKPIKDDGIYADVNGQVIASLFIIGTILNDNEILEIAKTAWESARNNFVLSLGDVLHTVEGRARTTSYLGDYLWLARAGIECYKATNNKTALHIAERIMLRVTELFEHSAGGYITSLFSEYEFAPFVLTNRNFSDDKIESLNSLAIRNFKDLSVMLNNDEHRIKALQTATAFAESLREVGLFGAGYARAIYQLLN
jgi:uncharacterized protein YyaL (SSP411 family)